MRHPFHPSKRSARAFSTLGLAAACCLPLGCAASFLDQMGLGEGTSNKTTIDVAIYRRAEVDRASQLEVEVERLRDDLRQAEEALVLAESGLRGSHTRADAVSSLAEARIQVERASGQAPWRGPAIREARGKLGEADNQIQEGHFGAALFFVYRATRIAEHLEREADKVAERPGTQYVRARRVNLRAGPSTSDAVVGVLTEGTPVFPELREDAWMLVRVTSGSVGWVHESLLRK
jgi:hypothetical protein